MAVVLGESEPGALPLAVAGDGVAAAADVVVALALQVARTVAPTIVLPVPALEWNWRFPETVTGPQPPICHGEPEPLDRICRLPSIVLSQITFAPGLSGSVAPVTPWACTLPWTVDPVSRRPLPAWTCRLPFTVTPTRSHHLPGATVRLPLTVVPFSCRFEQVTLPLVDGWKAWSAT